jgi:hypothetical protein
MNQLATAMVRDETRHQQPSRYESQWQSSYVKLQSQRQPRLTSGADAFAEVVMQAQLLAKQGKQPMDSGSPAASASSRQLLDRAAVNAGQQPGGGPRVWVAGVAPTTKGAATRSLQFKLPTEGGAAELSVPPARPAWYDDVEEEARPGDPKGGTATRDPGAAMRRDGSVKQLGSQKQLVASGASQKQLLQGSGKSGRLGAKEPPPKSKVCVIS